MKIRGTEDPKTQKIYEAYKKMLNKLNEADYVPGGRADKTSSSDVDQKELTIGIKIEMEHTDDKKLAKEIATDHLVEIPDYYTRLKKMEKEAGIKEGTDDIKNKIKEFFSKNPKPADADVHALAGKLNINPHKFEEHIYSILGELLGKVTEENEPICPEGESW